MKRAASITKAEIERALKAGKQEGAVKVDIDAGKFKLSYTLGENSGEKPKSTVAKPERML